jgi:hypothetical protein
VSLIAEADVLEEMITRLRDPVTADECACFQIEWCVMEMVDYEVNELYWQLRRIRWRHDDGKR